MMLFCGVEMTLAPVVVFRKLPGDQLMLPLAVALMLTLSPIQIVVSLGKVILGILTSRVRVKVSDPQESETITEKVVVLKIVAVGVGLLGLSSTFAGDQA